MPDKPPPIKKPARVSALDVIATIVVVLFIGLLIITRRGHGY